MKHRSLFVVLLLIFGVFETSAVWPYWYNNIWSGFILSDGSSYFSTELVQGLTTLLIVIPAFISFLFATLMSSKTHSRALRIVSAVLLALFVVVVILWTAGSIFQATHPPIGL